MFPSAGDELELKPVGLLVAITAFVYTRASLVDVFAEGAVTLRTLASLVPLALGLGVVVFGVALAVSTHDRTYVVTVARYFFASTIGMLVLVSLGAFGDGRPVVETVTGAPATVAVTASGVGGIVLGVVAARNHRQRRALRQRTDQATLLNRMLRHEILNGLTAIRGYTDLLTDGGTAEHDRAAIVESADRIERAVEDVRFLSPAEAQPIPFGGYVALDRLLEECRSQLEDIEAPIEFRASLPEVRVRADEHLQTVLHELVTTAAARSGESRIVVDATAGRRTVNLSVSAPGEWLSEVERAALLDGPPEYDDPRLDYGISIVRLLVARYGGRIALTTDEERTTVEVTLLRTSAEAPSADDHGLGIVAVSEAVVVGLLAGVAMGLVGQSLSGTMGVVGSLYGVAAPLLGWTVHLFHSVVFAIVAAMAWHHESLRRYVGTPVGAVTAGAAYGLLLWVFAGSVLMPLWLSLLGVPTPIPDFDAVSLLAHLVWGLSIGGFGWGISLEQLF